jgi:hypothetical protein
MVGRLGTEICSHPRYNLNRQLVADHVLVMNAEYQHHKRVWEMLKPRVYAQIKPNEPVAWARPPSAIPVHELLTRYPASIDLAMLAQGVAELNSPLSDY